MPMYLKKVQLQLYSLEVGKVEKKGEEIEISDFRQRKRGQVRV